MSIHTRCVDRRFETNFLLLVIHRVLQQLSLKFDKHRIPLPKYWIIGMTTGLYTPAISVLMKRFTCTKCKKLQCPKPSGLNKTYQNKCTRPPFLKTHLFNI